MSLLPSSRFRLGWWTLGIALAAALVYVVHAFVGTFVFGVFIYYATRPIYRRLRRVIRQPSIAAAVSLFALTLPALVLVAYAMAIALRELQKYVSGSTFDLTRWPFVDQEILATVAAPSTLLDADPATFFTVERMESLLASLGPAADTLAVVGVGLLHLFVMFALAFYLLRDGSRLSRWLLGRFGDDRGVFQTYTKAVDRDFKNIFFGNILNAVLTGTIGVLAYSVLNVYAPPGMQIPAAPLVGLLAGVASLIPVVGMKLVYVPVALYLAAVGLLSTPAAYAGAVPPWAAFVLAFALVSFVVVDTIPDLVIRPYVSGRSLHVGSLMIAYTLGPLLFGWYGIFLAPMLLVVVIHFVRLVLPELVAEEPLQPYAVDPGTVAAGGPDAATAFEFGRVTDPEE
jgi:predicted PurR-regulated permease PerM